MGLVQDQRPRDWAYMATFDKKDLPSLEEMARRIRETHDIDLIEQFNRKCEQKARAGADQNVTIEGITIQNVSKSGDLVVNGGLRHCINIILGLTSARWSHFGQGAGGGIAAVTDTALNGETISERVSLAWAESVGMRLLFGGIFGQTQGAGGPGTVNDLGVYNGSAAGAILLNHTYISSNNIVQQLGGFSLVYTAPVVISAVIEFCPMA